jgi:hypothetical protein
MPIPTPQPYTHVRLIADDGPKSRFEVRVSTFIEFDENAGRRAISGHPSRAQALERAKQIARSERVRTGAPEWK